MAISLLFPDNYGYAAMIAVGFIPILATVQGSVVTALRKPAGVPYPNAYATAEQAKNSKEAYKFNCAQRAHANLLENMPQVMAMILFAGIFHPNASASLGALWVVSRALYAYGYIASSKPNGSGRMLGAGHYIAFLGLLGLCFNVSYKLI